MRRTLFVVMLFWVMLLRMEGWTFARNSPNSANIVSTLPAASAFTNDYGIYGTNFIAIAPWISQGIFYQGDPVTISNSIGTTIEVYDFHGRSVTNAAPPVTLTALAMGHYFVQVDGVKHGFGDRSQFSVWPKGYTNYPHTDVGEPNTFDGAGPNRFVRLAPGWSRLPVYWSLTVSNATGVGTNGWDWTVTDQFLHGGTNLSRVNVDTMSMPDTPVPVKVLNIGPEHEYWMTHATYNTSVSNQMYFVSPYVDETNSLASFINDFCFFCSNVVVRYTNSYAYEPLNEPGSDFVFTDSYATVYNDQSYPVSLVVSAVTATIKYVCPSCQVWAPSLACLRNRSVGYFTNSYNVAGYNNVDVLTYHAYDDFYGPVDQPFSWTNSALANDGGYGWLPIDTVQKQASSAQGSKPFAITEGGPASPDVLGKTNSWWVTQSRLWTITNESGRVIGGYSSLPYTWQTLTFRFWKYLLEARSAGLNYVQMWLQLWDNDVNTQNPPLGYEGGDEYIGWDVGGGHFDIQGCGPLPGVDGEAMISWWLNGATPVMNWLSGSPLLVADPLGGYTSGTPGLHFYSWQFADGTTNTFVWADEEITSGVTTNLGVGVTDIFSNQWNGPIGIEPVIAWGWPNNSLGGSFSVVPVAAFSAAPGYGAVPMTVTFTDGSAGAITNHFWQFGDGFVTNTPDLTVVHRYTTPGSNTVQLIVSGPSGASTNVQYNMVIVTPFPPPAKWWWHQRPSAGYRRQCL